MFSKIEGLWDTYVVPIVMEKLTSHLMLHVVGVSNNFLGPQNCIRMPQNHCREAQSLDALLVMSTGPTPTITSIPKRGTYQCVNKALPI